MSELEIDWHHDGDSWVGDCTAAPHVLCLIVPAAWGKVQLRVFNRGAVQCERECSDADAAKDAAVPAVRLIALREAG